jgi:hypothetical protein
MSLPYVPADIIDEAKDRRRQGESIASLAVKIGISPEDLGALLGEPAWKPVPPDDANQEFDLFAVDRLDGVL